MHEIESSRNKGKPEKNHSVPCQFIVWPDPHAVRVQLGDSLSLPRRTIRRIRPNPAPVRKAELPARDRKGRSRGSGPERVSRATFRVPASEVAKAAPRRRTPTGRESHKASNPAPTRAISIRRLGGVLLSPTIFDGKRQYSSGAERPYLNLRLR